MLIWLIAFKNPGGGKINLRNKYIFWDIDGTLAAYRFNGHVSDPEGTDNGMSLKEIEDGVLSEDKSKADTILQYCKDHDISLQDVVFVDDTIPFLREAERKGIKSFHISSFLDWDFERRDRKSVV